MIACITAERFPGQAGDTSELIGTMWLDAGERAPDDLAFISPFTDPQGAREAYDEDEEFEEEEGDDDEIFEDEDEDEFFEDDEEEDDDPFLDDLDEEDDDL